MRSRLSVSRLFLFCLGALVPAVSLRADFVLDAVNNATIQPAGPRTGANGKRFFDVEGSSNGSFASFGVLDFRLTSPILAPVSGLTVRLTQDNASFTQPGALSFYLVSDTQTSIDPGSSPLTYQPSLTPGGLGLQLGTLLLLGNGAFTGVDDSTNGVTDVFSFGLGGKAQLYLDGQLAAGSALRVVVVAGDPNVAATYAGLTDTLTGPQLVLNSPGGTVPEPAGMALVVAGCACLLGARRWLASRTAASVN